MSRIWQQCSPHHNPTSDTPPSIQFLGTEDNYIAVDEAEAFQQQAKELGRRCDVHIYPGQGHGFFNLFKPNGKQYFTDTMNKCEYFLRELHFIS